MSADDSAALVSVRVGNDAPVDRHVRFRNRLDGPVSPPRRAGIPEPGWNNEGLEGIVPTDSTVALSYVIPPSPPGDHGAEAVDADGLPEYAVGIETLGRADESDEAADSTSEGVIWSLGPARPPADVVPTSADSPSTVSTPKMPEPTPNTAGDERPDPLPRPNPSAADGERFTLFEQPMGTDISAAAETRESRDHRAQRPLEPASLVAVERRTDLAERLDGTSAADATAALSEAEHDIEALESLDTDRRHFRRSVARTTALVDHAVDVDPDVDVLRRLV